MGAELFWLQHLDKEKQWPVNSGQWSAGRSPRLRGDWIEPGRTACAAAILARCRAKVSDLAANRE